MTVESVQKSKHELHAQLAKPEHNGLADIFSGIRHFDDECSPAAASPIALAAEQPEPVSR
jgi:hypothetical protein